MRMRSGRARRADKLGLTSLFKPSLYLRSFREAPNLPVMLFRKLPLAIILASFVLFSCSKKDQPDPAPIPTTDLKITFTDASGNKVSGASVSLYSNLTDFLNESSAFRTGTTDVNGAIIFSSLAASTYLWRGKSGCMSNDNSTYSTSSAISANQTTSLSSVMRSTGTLKFTNTSSNPYRVYVNGVVVGDQPGGTVTSLKYSLTGSYTVRVLQLSGYAVTPTDKTYTGSVTCGGTLNTTYP
jgi:hypothetical protein